jgi:hypothetical protein
MCEGSFQALAAWPQQAQAACAANAATIAIDRGSRVWLLFPFAPSPVGLRDVAAETQGFEIDE